MIHFLASFGPVEKGRRNLWLHPVASWKEFCFGSVPERLS
jgi:hypothetical protein